MNPIDYDWLGSTAGYYFSAIVKEYLIDIPVKEFSFEVIEEGETYHVLRVLNVAGDYHVFVQRRGDMIVDINTMSRQDLKILREMEGGG